MNTLPLWTIEVRPCLYFPTGTTQPKYAIGQLVKVNFDGYSKSVDVCCIHGLNTCPDCNDGWIYLCEYITCIQPGQETPEWDRGERDWIPETDLCPLTANDEAKLQQLESELCMQ